MLVEEPINQAQDELSEGMSIVKCRQCGCMQDALEGLQATPSRDDSQLRLQVETWLGQMQPIKYACLGCAHCYPAAALNALQELFPTINSSGCSFELKTEVWPPVAGEYMASCRGAGCPVAVSTLGSVELAEKLAALQPEELCIVGKTETENIGVDKVVKNIITNSTIRYLIVAGKDPVGHYPGATLLALGQNGVDEHMRVVNAPGKRPVLRNVTIQEVETFRHQVEVVDMIGVEDENAILMAMKELSSKTSVACNCQTCATQPISLQTPQVQPVVAKPIETIEMDKAGYFVILPQPDTQIIIVEQYAYDNTLLHLIEGRDARSLYWTIIDQGWVSLLSHAAYLGKELTRAELSMKLDFKFVQDGA